MQGSARKHELTQHVAWMLAFQKLGLDRSIIPAPSWAQVLDMVTDRLSTAGLLAVLGMLYPRSYMVFLAIMFLDIFSHWFQMYSTFISGSETHKVSFCACGPAIQRSVSWFCVLVRRSTASSHVGQGVAAKGQDMQLAKVRARDPENNHESERLAAHRTSTARAGWCACTTSTGFSWAPAASRARSCTCRCAPPRNPASHALVTLEAV